MRDSVPTVDLLNIFPQCLQENAGKLPSAGQYNMALAMHHT